MGSSSSADVFVDKPWLWIGLGSPAQMRTRRVQELREQRIAVVVAPRGRGKLATEAIIGKFGKISFETCMFESVADAAKWVSEP